MFHRLIATVAPVLALVGTALVVSAPGGAAAPAHRGVPMTRVTFKVAHCEGCRVHVQSARTSNYNSVWQSQTKSVRNGQVSFLVPTAKTRGLSVNATSVDEQRAKIPTGYVTMAVFRYAGVRAGQHMTAAKARTMRQGTACWAGTSRSAVTMPLVIRSVRVAGTTGMTSGTISWFPTMRRSMAPMQRTPHGVFGTQEVIFCGR